MADTIAFTRPVVAKLKCPSGRQEAFFWDKALPGFGVRCPASGARRYVIQYRTKAGIQRRETLGDPNLVNLDEARDKARERLAQVRLGGDPQGDQQAAREARLAAVKVHELVGKYLAHAESRLRPRSLAEVRRHLREHAKPLHDEIAEGVQRAEVARLLTDIAAKSGGVTANRVRSSLSAMWTWAVMEGSQAQNPVALTGKPKTEASRERVLTDTELAAIWNATGGDHDHDRAVRLLMLTGCRRDEVGRMRWSELTGDLWVIPGARTKNGLPLELPLPALAVAQLPPRRVTGAGSREAVFGETEAGFSGWSRCKARLDERVGRAVAAWTLHDLRRTMVTRVNELGLAEPHVIEALVNHASGGAKRGVAGVYNRASYRDQKRSALAKWADHVGGLVGQATANVVALGRG